MPSRSFVLIALLLWQSIGFAQDAQDAWYRECTQGEAGCEVTLFKRMAQIYRPSKEEDQIIAFIEAMYAKAHSEIWSSSPELSINKDRMGNLVIRLPATGKHVQKQADSVALQAHLDMVLDKKGAEAGEDLRRYFKDGVEFDEVEGWLQSKGNDKSIGADDTIGVALALRYLLDRKLEHPPLELVFTVQEEIGLLGAFGLEIPLRSKSMINLDGMTAQAITVGAQGNVKNLITGVLERSHLEENVKVYRLSVSDLKGGHSGIMIHRPRANAIQALAAAVSRLAGESLTEIRLIELIGGQIKVQNKIPSSGAITFAWFGDTLTTEKLKTALEMELNQFSDEDPAKYKIIAEELPPGHHHALSSVASFELLKRILGAPHGVVSRDGRFTDEVNTSTNLAAVSFLASQPRPSASAPNPRKNLVEFAFMTRSFSSADEMNKVVSQTKSMLGESWSSILNFKLETVGIPYEPWMARSDSRLLELASEDPYLKDRVYFPAGIETSAFMKTYPQMDMISLGPDILNQHTVNEKVRIKSVEEISLVIQKLLSRL